MYNKKERITEEEYECDAERSAFSDLDHPRRNNIYRIRYWENGGQLLKLTIFAYITNKSTDR